MWFGVLDSSWVWSPPLCDAWPGQRPFPGSGGRKLLEPGVSRLGAAVMVEMRAMSPHHAPSTEVETEARGECWGPWVSPSPEGRRGAPRPGRRRPPHSSSSNPVVPKACGHEPFLAEPPLAPEEHSLGTQPSCLGVKRTSGAPWFGHDCPCVEGEVSWPPPLLRPLPSCAPTVRWPPALTSCAALWPGPLGLAPARSGWKDGRR